MTAVLDAATEAQVAALDGGSLRVFEGTRLLAELAFSNPAFGPVRSGVVRSNDITSSTATESGIPDRWLALTSNGDPVFAGVDGEGLVLPDNQRYITAGAEVRVASLTLRQE